LKKLLQRWLTPKQKLNLSQQERLAAWRMRSIDPTQDNFNHSRCVVIDVETTGLNLMTDTLISIGAVALVDEHIVLGDSFYIVIQQRESSEKENILIHGISGTVQREGMDPVDALLLFLEFLGSSQLVAFHVAFDETMIRRALHQYLGISFKHPWLDLAYVMPALYPTLAYSHRVLDDWIRHFSLQIEARHNAFADALVTAQLLQIAQKRARTKNIADFAGLRNLDREQRELMAHF